MAKVVQLKEQQASDEERRNKRKKDETLDYNG